MDIKYSILYACVCSYNTLTLRTGLQMASFMEGQEDVHVELDKWDMQGDEESFRDGSDE